MDLSSINFVDLLERVGVRNAHMTADGVEINYSCHRQEHKHGDDNASAYVNSLTGAFFCHGCGLKGTVVDLVADVQQVSKVEARNFLRMTYGVDYDEPMGGSMLAEFEARCRPPAEKEVHVPPPESWLSSVRLDWHANDLEPFQRYMLDRGLSRDVLTRWDIGYCYVSDRLTIPIRALDGSLFGIKGRDWTGRRGAKYLVVGDRGGRKPRYGFGTYEVGEVVFGLHRARECKIVVCVEGEIDALALQQLGIERPIATGRAGMTVRQARLIADEADEVVLYYDAGSAGEGAVPEVVALLEPYVRLRIVSPLEIDPCDALRLGAHLDVLRVIREARSSLASHLAS